MTSGRSERGWILMLGIVAVLATTGPAAGEAQPTVESAPRLLFEVPALVTGQTESCVVVTYDLALPDGVAPDRATLEYSLDGGTTYRSATAVSGDVGAGIRPGVSRQVCWQAWQDVEVASFDGLPVRLAVIAVRVGPDPAPPAPAPSPALTPAPALPAAPLVSPLLGRISPGDRVRVELAGGRTVKGRIADLAPEDFGLRGKSTRVPNNSVVEVRVRRNDSIFDGLLIGTAVAFAVFTVGTLNDNTPRNCINDSQLLFECAVAGALFGGPIGMLIDARLHRYDVVYSQGSPSANNRVRLGPTVDPTRAMLAVSLRF